MVNGPPAVPAAAALRHREFRLFQTSRLFSTLALQMQGVAVGWQIYAVTGEPIHLGLVGLAQFLPMIALTLPAGDAADRFDRRRVVLWSRIALAIGSALLAVLSLETTLNVWAIYGVLFLIGIGRAFAGPAAQALMPNLVPPEHFSNAVAWSASFWQIAVIAGPAAGGLLYAGLHGAFGVYAACTLLDLLAVLETARIRTKSAARRAEPARERLFAGLRYVFHDKLVLGAISLDLFAVLLGGSVALLPVYARDILHVGPSGLGLLRSAPAVGAGLVAIWLALRPLARRAGAIMLACVGVFGVATIVFGVSRNFVLSLCALCAIGASDMVSVYVRHTLIQLATPDALRGRVSAVNLMFIGASNELGEFESGVMAAVFGTVTAVVIGGAGTCLVVVLWALLFPTLRRVDRLSDVLQAPPPALVAPGVPGEPGAHRS